VTPRGDRNYDSRTIDITFFIDEGPRVYIERIDVFGNDRTRDYVIRREFDVSEGDAYNKVLVNLGKTRLERLGFFDGVRITTRPGSAPDRVVLIVEVKDTATGEFSIGGGYSTTGGLIAEVSLAEKNFLGRGQFLNLSAGFGDNTSKYELSFTEPYFLGHRIAAGFDLLYQNAESNSDTSTFYDTETVLGRIRASAPITENFRFGVNYTLQQEDVTADAVTFSLLSPAVQDTIVRSPYTTSALGYNFLYSTLDSPKLPREGIYARLDQSAAGIGGDGNYIRTEGKFVGYYLISEDADIVFRGAAAAGNIHGFGSGTIRVTDHFYAGGESIKGFKTRGLGPRDALTGEALGGLIYYNAQAEIKFPFFFLPRSYGVYGAIFAEAGTLYDNDFVQPTAGRTLDSDSIRASVGASVIWDSPFGPLRADFAHILREESFDRTEPFRFGVTTAF
ncbi:MAG: outer membrane protein assembly factor BamA, partial [Rhizobiaceae bacterium]